jgi:uncharacterized membrane protein
VTVHARRPHNPSVRRLRFAEQVVPSLWFVPSLFVLASLVVVRITVAVDRRWSHEPPGWLIGGDAAAASAFATTVAAAMLSFAAVVFSTTLVAIQLAGGQYSPRVVRVFVRSRLTRSTLGLFLATFVVAVSAVVEDREETAVLGITMSLVYGLVVVTLLTFIAFVFGMSRLLRVQYLIERVTADGRHALRSAFRPDDAEIAAEIPDRAEVAVVRSKERSGVVQMVDLVGLVADAARAGVVIELLVEVGEYVGIGSPVATVRSGGEPALTGDDVLERCVLGSERTMSQDPGFAIRQLVDIAIRALSPAINDPTTAVQCLDRITDLLGDIVGLTDSSGWYHDDASTPRVHLRTPGVERLVVLGFLEIVRFGADSPQVVRRLRASFEALSVEAAPAHRPVVDRLRSTLDRAVAEVGGAVSDPWSTVPDQRGLG